MSVGTSWWRSLWRCVYLGCVCCDILCDKYEQNNRTSIVASMLMRVPLSSATPCPTPGVRYRNGKHILYTVPYLVSQPSSGHHGARRAPLEELQAACLVQ
jgi:hypothetical protein